MNQLIHLISSHPTTALYIGMFLLSAVGTTMPAPTDKSGNGYKWLYGILHFCVGNIGNLMPGKTLPQVQSVQQQMGGKYTV